MIYDPGLQPERTALAWNRTSLSLAVGGFVGLRVLPDLVGHWGVAIAFAVIVAGGVLGLISHRRTERSLHTLLTGEGSLPDARLLFAVAGVVAVVAAIAMVTVVIFGLTT